MPSKSPHFGWLIAIFIQIFTSITKCEITWYHWCFHLNLLLSSWSFLFKPFGSASRSFSIIYFYSFSIWFFFRGRNKTTISSKRLYREQSDHIYLFYRNCTAFDEFEICCKNWEKTVNLAIISRYNRTINRANISRLNRRFCGDFEDMGRLLGV